MRGHRPLADDHLPIRLMARPFFALLLVAAALAQATVLPKVGPVGVLPDLTLVLLLVWTALRGVGEGLAWVFAAGVLLDVLAMDPLGTNGLALVVVVLVAGLARRRFFHNGLIFPMVLAMVATVGHAVVLTILRDVETGVMLPLPAVVRVAVLQALLNAVLVPPLYLIAGWVNRWEPERA